VDSCYSEKRKGGVDDILTNSSMGKRGFFTGGLGAPDLRKGHEYTFLKTINHL
jgi:hypothetical protein